MKSILVVDDDQRLVYLIVELLKLHSYDAVGAISASEARRLLTSKNFDIVVVDWMMPNESGIDFIKSVRNSNLYLKDIPALMLTAANDIDNKVAGFEAGFDDYITKPFEEREFIARIRALLKRTEKETSGSVARFGNCEFNLATEKLKVDSKEVPLSTTESTLLKTLCSRPNQPFSRTELSRKFSFQVSDRTIDVQITRLRRKIGDDPKNPTVIKTARFIGYLLCCEQG
ncbi:MAG: response regulator transcription factor [Holosporales bacterium]|jgi:two-component system phosphate regulon response regulator OmpR|nr:response regulator transcription factor [Holosporales bacterium]